MHGKSQKCWDAVLLLNKVFQMNRTRKKKIFALLSMGLGDARCMADYLDARTKGDGIR